MEHKINDASKARQYSFSGLERKIMEMFQFPLSLPFRQAITSSELDLMMPEIGNPLAFSRMGNDKKKEWMECVMDWIERHPRVQKLKIRGEMVQGKAMERLSKNSTLTSLHIISGDVGNEEVIALVKNSTLRTLTIVTVYYPTKLGEKSVQALSENSTLTELDISRFRIRDVSLGLLFSSQRIKKLEVTMESGCSRKAFQTFSGNSALTFLHIDCSDIEEGSLASLEHHSNLKSLTISRALLSRENFREIVQNPTLTELHLRWCIVCRGFADIFTQSQYLKMLRITNDIIHEEELEVLVSLPLKLKIQSVFFKNEHIKILAKSRKPIELDIEKCNTVET
jgi:hypothetical protein